MIKRCLWYLFICLSTGQVVFADEQGQSPNLVVCISDNHATSLLGSLDLKGSSINPTPQLTRIIQSGFSHPLAYCTNSNSGKTAFPLLSGLPKHDRIKQVPGKELLPEYLNSTGYECAFFGSWTSSKDPQDFGFSSWQILKDSQIFFNPEIKSSSRNQIIEGHTTDVITDLAIRWLKRRGNNKKPFFMLVSYQATQRPWIPPVRMISKYNNEWFSTPDNFFTDFNERTPANKYQQMNIYRDLDPQHDLFLYNRSDKNITDTDISILEKNINSMNDEQKSAWTLSWKPQNEAFARESPEEDALAIFKYQRFLKNYLRCLLALDENIGRLFDSTKDVSNKQSYFMYLSERGSFTGEFGWFGNQWMYEPSSRIPFIFSSINGSKPSPFDPNKPFADTDFYQFIKNLCGTLKDEKNTGSNEVYNLISPDKDIYFTQNIYPGKYHVAHHHGLRKGKYKIIHYHSFNEWEFYDLEDDPHEEKNLVTSPDLKETIREYRDLLKQAAESSNYSLHKKEFPEDWKRIQRSPDKKTR